MAEALFIETLRCYMEQLPPEQTGWLAGARDPIVGGCLALMHRSRFGAGVWRTLRRKPQLRSRCLPIVSRSSSARGRSTYLARWRLQLAARLLQTTRKTIVQVASEVGYESEAAFNRAFKREFELPPAKYRNSFSR